MQESKVIAYASCSPVGSSVMKGITLPMMWNWHLGFCLENLKSLLLIDVEYLVRPMLIIKI